MKKIVFALIGIACLSGYSSYGQNSVSKVPVGTSKAVEVKKSPVQFKESHSTTNRKVSSSEYYKVKETGEILPIGVTPAEAERKRFEENAVDGHKITDPAIIARREKEMREKKASLNTNNKKKRKVF